MNECLCENCDEWFAYSEHNCVNESTSEDQLDYHWYCDDCIEQQR